MGTLELESHALDNTVARVHLDDPENLLELWNRPLRGLPRFSRTAEELAIHEGSLIATHRHTYIFLVLTPAVSPSRYHAP